MQAPKHLETQFMGRVSTNFRYRDKSTNQRPSFGVFWVHTKQTPGKFPTNTVETARVCEICNLPRKFRPERYPSGVIMKKHQLFLEVPIIGARWWFQPIWRNSHIGTFPSIFWGEKIQQSFTKLPQSTRRIIPAFVSGSYSWLVSPLCRVVPLPNGRTLWLINWSY